PHHPTPFPYTTLFRSLTASQIKTQILNSVDPILSLNGKTVTGGRLNAYRALSTSYPTAPPVPTGLTAVAGNGQVSLSWNISAGADRKSTRLNSSHEWI